MKNQINVGLIGFGVVGSGTMQILREHRAEMETRIGAKLHVKWVCNRRRKKSPLIPRSARFTKNWRDVVTDPEVDCVIELIGGVDPARRIVTQALNNGKHVVTANKTILSHYWGEIIGLAHRRRRLVYFEAAVGGGVPVVQALNEGLAGTRIRKIIGILNGTTNYILTQMQEGGLEFGEALALAQKAGFAEANPSADVRGVDAAQKISILGSLALGVWVPPETVYCEGLSGLQSLDIQLIKSQLHSTLKLLAIAEKSSKGWIFRVHPALIHQSHPFANVRNEYNAVSFFGNATQDIMLSGKGAGRLPTASAVISDLIFLSRQIATGTAGRLPYVSHREPREVRFASVDHVRCRYYLRATTSDTSGVLSKITGILGKHGVSIATIHQDTFEQPSDRRGVPILFLTHENQESNVQAAVKEIDRLRDVRAKTVLLRME